MSNKTTSTEQLKRQINRLAKAGDPKSLGIIREIGCDNEAVAVHAVKKIAGILDKDNTDMALCTSPIAFIAYEHESAALAGVDALGKIASDAAISWIGLLAERHPVAAPRAVEALKTMEDAQALQTMAGIARDNQILAGPVIHYMEKQATPEAAGLAIGIKKHHEGLLQGIEETLRLGEVFSEAGAVRSTLTIKMNQQLNELATELIRHKRTDAALPDDIAERTDSRLGVDYLQALVGRAKDSGLASSQSAVKANDSLTLYDRKLARR